MEGKYKKFYVEWWRIRRSTVTGLVVFGIVTSAVVFGGWWAIKNNWFVAQEQRDIPVNAARIVSFEGDVRITRSATRETIVVTKETWIAAGDTIQTQADGRATVHMIDGSLYYVKPNSSIIIRDNSSFFGGNNVRVSLDDGQLNVRTEDQPNNAKNIVEMRDSETQLNPQTDASFNADAVNGGSEIRISRGSVETSVGGAKTTIGENQFASINSSGVTQKEALLPPPRLVSPANLARVMDPSGSGATIGLNWQNDSGAALSSYYLQVARSSYFAADSIFVDRNGLSSAEFRVGGLSPGTYYWRVKSTARSGQVSEWSEPFKFDVVRRAASRAIEVTGWSVENVGGNVYIIGGRTEPGLLVKSQANQVYATADGTFRLQISSMLSETAIEFSDDRGDRAGFVISLRNARVLRKF